MDIFSHGLYGGVAFGRKSRVSYAKSFFFGIMPDLFSFGILFGLSALSLVSGPHFRTGAPAVHEVPAYISSLYSITHSLVIASVVIGIVWMVRKKFLIELFAWPLHILVDIPTHSSAFFPTPFLWPLSDFTMNGVSWGQPMIFYPNIAILIVLYLWWYVRRHKDARAQKS